MIKIGQFWINMAQIVYAHDRGEDGSVLHGLCLYLQGLPQPLEFRGEHRDALLRFLEGDRRYILGLHE